MKRPYPTTRALAEMVRANDARAVAYIVSELKRAKGNVSAAAAAIGCGQRTLYAWRDSNEALRQAFVQHALGREGSAIEAHPRREGKAQVMSGLQVRPWASSCSISAACSASPAHSTTTE
jgi:transposase-like protein